MSGRSIEEQAMSYQGVERRRFFTYVTRNTEYHFHDGICVAVRDRRTGQFLAAHVARGMRLVGGVNMSPLGPCLPKSEKPDVGDALCMTKSVESSHQIVTSRVEAIERPSRETVAMYS
jgi:hypothetical protein